jgi:hypothetical protein
MYAVLRTYSGVGHAAVDALVARQQEVERILSDIPGFRSYYLIRTADGMASVTVCDDKAGTEKSTQAAAAFLRQELPGQFATPPTVIEGEVAIGLG